MNQNAEPTAPDEIAKYFLVKGVECEREESWSKAVECYESVLSSTTQQDLYLYFGNNNLAYSLIQLGKFDEAEPFCRTAIAINEHQHNAHKNLGLVFRGQGLWLQAASCFATAYHLAPQDARAWHLLNSTLADHPELIRQSDELRAAMLDLAPPAHQHADQNEDGQVQN